MQIVWSPLAVERISEIVDYIFQFKPMQQTNGFVQYFQRLSNFSPIQKLGGLSLKSMNGNSESSFTEIIRSFISEQNKYL